MASQLALPPESFPLLFILVLSQVRLLIVELLVQLRASLRRGMYSADSAHHSLVVLKSNGTSCPMRGTFVLVDFVGISDVAATASSARGDCELNLILFHPRPFVCVAEANEL